MFIDVCGTAKQVKTFYEYESELAALRSERDALTATVAELREQIAEAAKLIDRAEQHAPPCSQTETLCRDWLSRRKSNGDKS